MRQLAFPLRAYHGSPHAFDAFCPTCIGTGEGNQTFGFGLYFAEHIEVARHYQTLLANKLAAATPGVDVPLQAGNLYTVEIHRRKEEFLDWDKPLAAQSGFVRDRLRLAGVARDYRRHRSDFSSPAWTRGSEGRGHNVYGFLSWRKETGAPGTQGDRQASALLAAMGLAGIRYLDQGSRGRAGRGTHNFVLFDAGAVVITHRNGAMVDGREATPAVLELPLQKFPADLDGYLLDPKALTKQSRSLQIPV